MERLLMLLYISLSINLNYFLKIHQKEALMEQTIDSELDARSAKLVCRDDLKISSRSLVLDVFWGQLKSTLRCSCCGNQMVKFQAFSHLSLPVAASPSRFLCANISSSA